MKETINTLIAPELSRSLRNSRFGKLKLWLLAETKRHYEKTLLSLVEHNTEARLADFGYGDGRLTMKVARAIGTEDINGYDIVNNSKYKEIKHTYKNLNSPTSWVGEYTDVVIASQIIEHLYDTDRFLCEISQTLKPSGYALISTPNLASWHNILYLLLGKQPEPCSISDEVDWAGGPAHRRMFTIPGLSKVLKHHGFKIEKIVGSGFNIWPKWLARLLCKIDRRHAVTITFKVRRA